jgi:hypothetical protein
MTFACWPTSSEWIQPARLCGYARTSTPTNPYPRDQPPCFRSFSAGDSETLHRVLKRYRVKLVKVNMDDSPKLQQRFNVMAIPTLMVLRRGQVAAQRGRCGAGREPAHLGGGGPRELAGLGMRPRRAAGKL